MRIAKGGNSHEKPPGAGSRLAPRILPVPGRPAGEHPLRAARRWRLQRSEGGAGEGGTYFLALYLPSWLGLWGL